MQPTPRAAERPPALHHAGALHAAGLRPDELLLEAEAANPANGDFLRLSLKLRRAGQVILDAGCDVFGTAMPVASATRFCALAKGKTLDAALQIGAEDLQARELQFHQPVLVLLALDTAARQLRGLPPRWGKSPAEPPLCLCWKVSEHEVERAIRLRGLRTPEQISAATRASTGCGTCRPMVEEVLRRCREGKFAVRLAPEDFAAARRIYGPPADAMNLKLAT